MIFEHSNNNNVNNNNNNNNRSLGSVTKNCDKWLEKLDIHVRNYSISLIQKTTLLGTARILRKVLDLYTRISKEMTSKGPLVMGYDSLP